MTVSGLTREEARMLERAARMQGLPLASLLKNEELLAVFCRAARLVLEKDVQGVGKAGALAAAAKFLQGYCPWLKMDAEEALSLLVGKGVLSEHDGLFGVMGDAEPAEFTAETLLEFLKEAERERTLQRERRIAELQRKNETVNARPAPAIDPEFDRSMMALAMEQAACARQAGEVPVGAVLVLDGKILAAAGNRVVADHDPTAHAEMLVIRKACSLIRSERLPGATLYVTLEPCGMCAAAVSAARVRRVVWAAGDPQRGAFGGRASICDVLGLNHRASGSGGLMADESGRLLDEFFRERRRAQEAVDDLA